MSNNTSNQDNVKVKIYQEFAVIHPNAAGIDIGSRENWVCVSQDNTEKSVMKFGTFTCDLYAIARWLKENEVKTVAMESTGVYWKPLFLILEQEGFEVYLSNAKQSRNVPGRPKTDRHDCRWLQKLHTSGLISPSFQPPAQIRKIRVLLRHRDNLIKENATNIQHMQKALELMNIKLTEVISDITGVTGLKIIEAILKGERNLETLANLKDRRIKATTETICKALQGDYREEDLFTLRQSLSHYQFILQQVNACDQEIEKYLQEMAQTAEPTEPDPQLTFEFAEPMPNNPEKKPVPDNPEKPVPDNPEKPVPDNPIGSSKTSIATKRKPKKNAPAFPAAEYLYQITGVNLTEIPGIHESTALTIISEIGLDMHKWESEKHFTSWLGLSPNRKITGGKVISSTTRKVQNRAAQAFRMAALSLKHAQCYLGAFFRRIAAKRDFPKAVTATARKLAIIFYHMLKDGSSFSELGQDYYDTKYRELRIENLKRQAVKLGFQLVPANVME